MVSGRLNWMGAALLAGMFIIAGCNKSDESTSSTATTQGSGAAATAGGKTLNLAFVTNNASDFWTIARAGTAKAMEEMPNVKVDFQIPSSGSAADQKRIVDDLLTRGIDGIAISPVDPANETPMINQVAKQTLVFCHDSDAPNSDRACYVGTDNVAAGRQAGDIVKQALPNGGKIMVFVGKRDAQNARERYQGLEESLKGSNVQILDVRTDDTDRARAKSNVQETLVNYPDIAGLVGLWSYNGPAIYNAVKEANKAGQVKIVCFDEEDETLAGVKAGAIYATVVQQPYEFGHMAITLMAKYLQGDKSVVPPTKQIFIPTLAITQDKVDAFKDNLDKLRGRK
ncbi:MAG TPA: sugar-binding protein [Tepidisphaeraceae bacterium]|nr:sugar-binding protein [Tepidisphaeraceae bacterium]